VFPLCGICLFLVVVQAETEAAMKQAQSASRAAESLLKNDGTNNSLLVVLID
jgi:hypothetical protein